MGGAGNVFLTGLMGSGKSSVGRRLATLVGFTFIDLDQVIEARRGRSIADIFENEGEPAFRQIERETLVELLTMNDGHKVMALGGGTYTLDGVAEMLRSQGPTIWLDADPKVLASRLASERENRPLLARSPDVAETLRHQLDARRARYALADIVVSADASAETVTQEIARTLFKKSDTTSLREVLVDLGPRSYPIWVSPAGARGAAHQVISQIATWARQPARIAVVADEHVADLHGSAFLDELVTFLPTELTTVPRGEAAKTTSCLAGLWDFLLGQKLGRRDVVVALGGGCTGDVAGFAAATLKRGVRFIQVPTTVLAAVDASVGGKTAINHDLGKNLIGAFYQPAAVVIGLGLLATLDARQVRSGLAEVVKYAVLEGDDLMNLVEGEAASIVADPCSSVDLIARSCQIKARIVAADELEQAGRALLNLGHTFGHAIEAVAGYGEVLHGEAVGLGMLMACRAARVVDPQRADAGLEQRITRLLEVVGLPTDVAPWLEQADRLAEAMHHDKKSSGDHLDLIIPFSGGDVAIVPHPQREIPSLLAKLPTC